MGETFRWFDEGACTRCGMCLESCAVLECGHAEAVREIGRLIEGRADGTRAFRRCTTCNACDFVCPEDAHPYELILESFDAWRRRHGLPYLARLVFPECPENMWSGLETLMASDERACIREWEERLDARTDEIVLTGFYTNLVPFLALSPLLDDLRGTIAGGVGLYGCGGDTHKLGMPELTSQVATLVHTTFQRMGLRRVWCFMQAESAMLSEILPRFYGQEVSAEVHPLDELLLQRLEGGQLRIERPLNLCVTVHDNCMSRYGGGRAQEVLRALVRHCGCEIHEMHHTRMQALCCGWAATIPTLHGRGADNPLATFMYLLESLYRRLQEAEDTGAAVLLADCPACYLFLALIAELTLSRVRVCHTLELLGSACGYESQRRIEARAWDLLAISANLLYRWVRFPSARERFHPRDIDTVCAASPAPARPSDRRRIRAIAGFLHSRAVQNRYSRALIAAGVKGAISLSRRVEARRDRRLRGEPE